jgi:tetratricopeptide (TPR) repeat protein
LTAMKEHISQALGLNDAQKESKSIYDRRTEIKIFNENDIESFEKALSNGLQIEHELNICDEIIKKNPADEKAWYKKGINLSELGYYDDAIKCFDEIIKINPRYGPAYYAKGVALRELGRSNEAEEAFAEQRQCWKY